MTPEAWIALIGIGAAVIGGLLAYYTRANDARMENAFRRIEQLEAAMIRLPDVYARRDDFKDLIRDVFAQLNRIEGKIDKKADKP